MSDVVLIDPQLWAATRSGARAGRGFRYQDVATAMLAVDAWAGAEWSAVVPEGVDDATLHGADREFRVQVKSRHDPRGRFSPVEVGGHIAHSARALDKGADRPGRMELVLLLERPVDGVAATGWDRFLGDDGDAVEALRGSLAAVAGDLGIDVRDLLSVTRLVVVPDPTDAIVRAVVARTGCVEAAGRLVSDRLRQVVGRLADENYRAPAGAPASIGAGDVQRVVDDVLRIVDRDGIEAAVSAGLCEPVTFAPVDAPGFYDGVDVTPGHVGAGLVLDRPGVTDEVSRGLQRLRAALVAGPSGSGKSAAAWLAAHGSRHAVRWYRVSRAAPEQVHLLVELARALEASAERPVGFVFDDLGRGLAGGWDGLRRAVADMPGVLMLGTVREEDLYLVADLASTALVRPLLDEDLAARIWSALGAGRELAFVGWREPHELSRGLMLEYVHLLTSGQRLQETLDGQVRRRLRESRDDELAVLRGVVSAARLGGAVDPARLRARLALTEGNFSRALARLVDEHAVRVAADGSLTGLHEIRSSGLHGALGRELPRGADAAVGELVDVLDPASFATVLPRLLAEGGVGDEVLVDALAPRAASLPAAALATAFYGLGLVMCDRIAERWLAITAEEGIEPRHAVLPLTLAIGGTPTGIPQLTRVDAAIGRRGELAMVDLRAALLARIAGLGHLRPTLAEYHDLAAALVPLPFLPEGPAFDLLPEAGVEGAELDAVTELLSTTSVFGGARAQAVVDRFGGTGALLKRIHREKAWVTRPVLRAEADGLVVASDVRYVDPVAQADPNGVVVAHCARLLAVAPSAEFAASTMLGWDGRPAGFADVPVARKRLPRAASPPEVAVAWNRAMLRGVQRRNAATTESGRANALSGAVTELGDLLADAAELQCRGSTAVGRAELMVTVRTLLNSFIEAPGIDLGARSPRDAGAGDINDELHDFVTSVTDLVRDLGSGPIERPLLKSADAARLRASALRLRAAQEWRWLDEPPTGALDRLAGLLGDIDAALGLAHGDAAAWRQARVRAERSSRRNRTLPRFAADARTRAGQRAAALADEITGALAGEGRRVRVVSRPAADDAPFWPRVEYLALVDVPHLIGFAEVGEELVAVGRAAAGVHPLYLAPVREGFAVGMGAGLAGSVFIPDLAFAERWGPLLPVPLVVERAAAALGEAVSVAVELSSALANADRPPNAQEEAYAQRLVDRVRAALAELQRLRDEEPDEDMMATSAFVVEILDRLQAELADGFGGRTIAAEVAMLGFGERTDFAARSQAFRIGLLERDVLAAASTRDARCATAAMAKTNAASSGGRRREPEAVIAPLGGRCCGPEGGGPRPAARQVPAEDAQGRYAGREGPPQPDPRQPGGECAARAGHARSPHARARRRGPPVRLVRAGQGHHDRDACAARPLHRAGGPARRLHGRADEGRPSGTRGTPPRRDGRAPQGYARPRRDRPPKGVGGARDAPRRADRHPPPRRRRGRRARGD